MGHQLPGVLTCPVSLPGLQPAVFAFPCATLITVMLAFIMYMTLRNATQQKDMVEVGVRQGGGWTTRPGFGAQSRMPGVG